MRDKMRKKNPGNQLVSCDQATSVVSIHKSSPVASWGSKMSISCALLTRSIINV